MSNRNADNLLVRLRRKLSQRTDSGLLRALTLPHALVDFSSNDYLGLSGNKKLHSKFTEKVNAHADLLGSTGSRLLNGNSQYALDLESFLCNYHKSEAALLFNSGYDANLSFFGYVPQPNDIVLYDELIHASVHDGLKFSRAKSKQKFKHNDVDDAYRLCIELRNQRQSSESSANGNDVVNIFVAVETIYSMDGDFAPLTQLVSRLKPLKNVYIVVDEAHATGAYGKMGKGVVCELALENEIFARLHTFGKAMGAHGAVILGSPILREYMINYARPLIYSTFISHHSLLGIKCAYDFLAEEWEDLQTRLQELILHFRHTIDVPDSLILESHTSIQGIIVPGNNNTNFLATHLRIAGYDVRPIRSPTVPKGKERVRICIHAHNTFDEIDSLCGEVKRGLMILSVEAQRAKL